MRIVIGPTIDKFSLARTLVAGAIATAVAPPEVAKADPAPSVVGVDAAGEPVKVRFNLPAYDLATSNRLVKVQVIVLPADHGHPDSVDGWLATSYPRGEVDTSGNQASGEIEVPVADLPDGDFVGQTLFTYEA